MKTKTQKQNTNNKQTTTHIINKKTKTNKTNT